MNNPTKSVCQSQAMTLFYNAIYCDLFFFIINGLMWGNQSSRGKPHICRKSLTTKIANSPWLLDNREICFTYTCNRPIKTKYFLYKVYLLILYYVIKFVSDLRQVLCDKVCQWFAADMWFSPGTLVSSHQTIDYKKKKDHNIWHCKTKSWLGIGTH
jgi:hypothetical protein